MADPFNFQCQELSKSVGKPSSVPHTLLKGVFENDHMRRDVPKLSPVHQAYCLEVFHSIVNQFAPKSTHFFYAAMLARLSIAAIHYNRNCGRQQLVIENGDLCYNISYPKAKKGTEEVVKPRKGPPTCGYVTHKTGSNRKKKSGVSNKLKCYR